MSAAQRVKSRQRTCARTPQDSPGLIMRLTIDIGSCLDLLLLLRMRHDTGPRRKTYGKSMARVACIGPPIPGLSPQSAFCNAVFITTRDECRTCIMSNIQHTRKPKHLSLVTFSIQASTSSTANVQSDKACTLNEHADPRPPAHSACDSRGRCR